MSRAQRAASECPQCGALVPAGRLACAECGSDAQTGWKAADEIDYQAVELPDAGDAAPAKGSPWMLLVLALTVVGLAIAAVIWR